MSKPRQRAADAGRHVCVLIPAYNEAEVLPAMYRRLAAVADRCTPYTFSLLFIDDGSRDGTLELVKALGEADPRVEWVSLSRNFGKEAAIIAGIDHIDADALIILDADLQDPPELIPVMLAEWEQGWEDVYARRRSRAGESALKKWTSRAFYRLLQQTTHVPIQRDTGDFRLLDRRCIEALRRLREHERYTKGMFSLIGFRKKEILFDREPRAGGTTKWSYGRLLDLAIDGITSFTTSPLRIATVLGLVVTTAAFVHLLYLGIAALFFGVHVSELVAVAASLMLVAGLQLISLGIIGEYVGRIFTETKNRPLYLVEETRLSKQWIPNRREGDRR